MYLHTFRKPAKNPCDQNSVNVQFSFAARMQISCKAFPDAEHHPMYTTCESKDASCIRGEKLVDKAWSRYDFRVNVAAAGLWDRIVLYSACAYARQLSFVNTGWAVFIRHVFVVRVAARALHSRHFSRKPLAYIYATARPQILILHLLASVSDKRCMYMNKWCSFSFNNCNSALNKAPPQLIC